VTLGRGKQAQVLTGQEAGWAREAVLKLQRKENSLSLAMNQTPIPRSTSHSLCYYSELVSSYYIKASRTFKNSSFKDYKISYDTNTILSFLWITGANSNRKLHRGRENIFPDSSRNYNIEIKKGMKILQRNLQTQFQLPKKWQDA